MKTTITPKASVIFCILISSIILTSSMASAARKDVEAFVTRFYQLVLDREPDASGLNAWVDGLLNQTLTGADVAFGFVLSPEFLSSGTSNEEFLNILYAAFFDRSPDPGGYRVWRGTLDRGTPREVIISNFLGSDEFSNVSQRFGITPRPPAAVRFVTRLYQLILSRAPDKRGLDDWANWIRDGTFTPAEVARQFVLSPELTQRNTSNDEYLRILYAAFFDREPDPDGFNGWLSQLQNGESREVVLNGFNGSQEFAALVASFNIGAPETVDESLNALGVTTTATPRVDENSEPLPDNYSPLGASFSYNPKEPDDPAAPFGINKTDELFFVGLQLDVPGVFGGAPTIFELSETDLNATPTLLFEPDAGSTPWFEDGLSSRVIAQTLRAAAAGDIDGDGLEETVVIYKGATAVGNAILLTTYDDKEGAFAEESSGSPIAASTNVQDISVAAGDFNGDGSDELVVALGKGGSVELLFLAKEGGEFKVQNDATKTLSATLPNPQELTIYTALATGNIDYDSAEELVIIMNQIITASKDTGAARYFIYDDSTANYAQLGTGNVAGPDANGLTKSAVVADVSLGDIDADGLEEIVFGGLTNIRSGGNSCIAYGHLLIALDDAKQDLAFLGTKFFEHFYKDCPAFSSWKMRYLHVNTVDLDGDGVKEIQANQFIYDNFVNAPPWTERPAGSGVALIPEEEFFQVNDFGWFDKSTTTVVACDVTGDGRENVIFHTANRSQVTVWGEDQVNGWEKMSGIPVVRSNAQNPENPIIVAVNVDTDSPVLKYSEAEYRFGFTEPIIIAAMAAAPCGDNIGQVIGDCRTRFGTAVLQSTDNSVSFSVSAGIHYGASAGGSFFGIKFEAEVKNKISIAASLGVTKSYELKKSVVFTSGPLEDAVIFSTIPMDQYIYTVVSHPLPELIGEKVTISVPREPVVIMTERGFYNQNVADGSPKIDTSIFGHTPGDLFSYPRESEAITLTSGNRDLRSGPQSVDQGGGFREVDIEVTETTAFDTGFEISYEQEVTVTAGSVLGGYTVGASAGTNLTLTNGTSTLYSGSVGAINADNFIANLYTYGLFAYKKRDSVSGQEFEVINYWVDPPR